MHYRLTCPCGVSHRVSASQAGQEIHCACGNPLPVPTLRGLKELPPFDPLTTTAASQSHADEVRRPAILLGTLFAIVFVAVPMAIFFAYQRSKLDTSMTREADQQRAAAQLDVAGPLELSEAWNTYSTIPLGPPVKPPFYAVQSLARALEWRIAISCGIALLAALAAAVILVLRRQSREHGAAAQAHSGS